MECNWIDCGVGHGLTNLFTLGVLTNLHTLTLLQPSLWMIDDQLIIYCVQLESVQTISCSFFIPEVLGDSLDCFIHIPGQIA